MRRRKLRERFRRRGVFRRGKRRSAGRGSRTLVRLRQPDAARRVEILHALERKLLWLSAWMIHHANHIRPNRDGLKVGGLDADVIALHGELPPAEQDRALSPSARRKVVLSTSIAETSLTVPGVRIVVDGGFRRVPRLDPASGLSKLVTVRIGRATAEQRAGRAGRTEPGVAIRLWSEALHRGLPLADRPEILEAELSGLALDCAAWGAEPGRELGGSGEMVIHGLRSPCVG